MDSSQIAALRELKSLLDDGILTQEEFNQQKAKVLRGEGGSRSNKRPKTEPPSTTSHQQPRPTPPQDQAPPNHIHINVQLQGGVSQKIKVKMTTSFVKIHKANVVLLAGGLDSANGCSAPLVRTKQNTIKTWD